MGGDIDVNATLRRGDFSQRHFDLSGTTVELRNVQVAGTQGSTAWKGRVDFKRGASMRSRRSRWMRPRT